MRGDLRRASLLDAATRVAARTGAEGLSVRAVAAEAGVSPGSVLYHFGDRDGMVRAAVAAVLERFADRRRQAIEAVDDPAQRIVTLVELGIPDRIDGSLRILYANGSHAQSSPAAAALHRAVVERQVDLYSSTIELGERNGSFAPVLARRAVARSLVALEDAFDLYAIVGFADRAREHRALVLDVASTLLGVALGASAEEREERSARVRLSPR